MEKSENNRLKHKSKTLVLDNKEIIDKYTNTRKYSSTTIFKFK